MKDPLLFIDTNILLDCYRSQKDAGLRLLSRLESLHDRIICTYQIEMEFKKNRQSTILTCMKEMHLSDAKLAPPAFLSDAKTVEIIKKQVSDTKDRIDNFKKRITRILTNPGANDTVFQITQRLFAAKTEFNLRERMNGNSICVDWHGKDSY